MSNILQFRQRTRVEPPLSRVIVSDRFKGMFEAQSFEGGGWRPGSVHPSREQAVEASKLLAERVIMERMAAEKD